jgi:hypothetical protein
MGQENDTIKAVGKGNHFTGEQRQMLDWHWNGTGGSKKIRGQAVGAAARRAASPAGR